MRIGLVIYGSLDTLSGGYLYDRQLVQQLRAEGANVEVISLPWRTYLHHLVDNCRWNWASSIVDAQYDVLLQDELNHPSLLLLNRYLRLKSTAPIVSIVHHLRSSEPYPRHLQTIYRAVEREYLRTVDGFICNSRTTLTSVQSMLNRCPNHVIAFPAANHRTPPPHAVVVSRIKQRLATKGTLRLLFIGNIMPRKGLHTVLDALAILAQFDWHLHIVGSELIDPRYSRHMRDRARDFGIQQRITWHGRVSDETLGCILADSDLLTMPAYEGFGIVFLEAMAHGLPVLAANTGAAPEVISPGINGDLVEYEDSAAFAKKLNLFIENRSHLANLAYQARLRFENHPSWSESMRRASEWLHEFAHPTSTPNEGFNAQPTE